ncbi:MAG: hypothetical protein ACK4MS_08430 [Paracoccaceae bacterium]
MSDSAFPSLPAGRSGLQDTGLRSPVPIFLLVILVIMVPIEFSLHLGSIFLTASRAYLIVLFFMILPYLGTLRLRLFDWFFIGHVAWTCVAYMLIYPLGQAIEMAGSYFLEFLVVYMAARIYLQRVEQMRAVVILLFVLATISAAVALPEALTGIRFVHDLGTALTGITYRFSGEMRMGITRAASFFEHPILYGIFCASVFSLTWFTSTPVQRAYRAPILIGATWLSASSAPLLTLLVQILLIGLEYVTRKIKRRDKLFAWVAGGFVLIVETLTGRGVVGIVTMMTLNPGTAYTRRAQWNFAIDDVLRNPWFGFVPGRYTRPFWLAPSIDNWWLLIMMRSGIPSLILLALSALFLWIAIARREGGPVLFSQLRTGWGLMMIAVILGAATVTFFGKLQPLFAFYMGFGAALASCLLPQAGDAEPQVPTGRGGLVYTRFPGTLHRMSRPGRGVADAHQALGAVTPASGIDTPSQAQAPVQGGRRIRPTLRRAP